MIEYYSAIKTKEPLTRATTWVNLKNTLKEIRHKRLHSVWWHLHEMFRNDERQPRTRGRNGGLTVASCQ